MAAVVDAPGGGAEDADTPGGPPATDEGRPRRGAIVAGAVLVAGAGLLAGFAWILSSVARSGTTSAPDYSKLSILLILGTVSLLLMMGVLAIVYAKLGLADSRYALGLPEGSVRAVLALLLILLFFISSIFFATTLSTGSSTRELKGITAAQLATIPTSEIKSQAPVAAPAATTSTTVGGTNGSTTTLGPSTGTTIEPTTTQYFDVVLFVPADADSRDLAKQVVTSGATLVAAISAFYFGASAVQQASKPHDGQAAEAPGGPSPPVAGPPPGNASGGGAAKPGPTGGPLSAGAHSEPGPPDPVDDFPASDQAMPSPDQTPTLPGGV